MTHLMMTEASIAQGMLVEHPVARSTDPCIVRDAVNDLTLDQHALRLNSGAALNGSVNGVSLGPLSLVHVAYGEEVTITSPPTDHRILVVFPLGPMAVQSGTHQWASSAPFALSTTRTTAMVPDPSRGALIGGVESSVAANYFARISGRSLAAPITLDSRMPLQLGTASLVSRTWMEACLALDALGASREEHVGQTLLNTLFSTLLLGLTPHLKCFEPQHSARDHPDYLVAAKNFIDQNFAGITRISLVSQTVGISSRQLQHVFTRHMGTTPILYLREVRLMAAHRLLLEASPGQGDSVSSIASRVGFDHLGRFSAYYGQKFGSAPSQTLAAA